MEDEVVTESADSNSSTNTVRTNKRTRNDRLVSGKFKGVVPQQNGHWGAQIYTKHKRIWLGTFKSETEAAMAYDSAAIKLRSGDSSRNFPWTNVTLEEPDFQARYTTEAVLNMLKDGSYQSKFADFLRSRSQSAEDNELGSSLVKGDAGGGRLFSKQLFQKELTPSDVGKLNRLVIPKKYAVKYFPPILESADENADPDQDVQLVFYDKLMRLWKFRYCYWRSSQSFVFTRGWNRFVKEKELKAHETITFFLCEHRDGTEQKQKFCMIDVERDQINGASDQNVGMHVELQMALRSSTKLEEEDQVVVEVEPLELQLALRPSIVVDDEKEDEATDYIAEKHFELELALKPSTVVCCKEEDAEGFKLFGVQIKRQCCRVGSSQLF